MAAKPILIQCDREALERFHKLLEKEKKGKKKCQASSMATNSNTETTSSNG